MTGSSVDDVRSTDPVERLLEDSWESRSRRLSRREVVVEAAAAILFICAAVPLALLAPGVRSLDVPLAVALVALYSLASRLVKFPIGAGYVVPSWIVLAPMLLLLPPRLVPLLVALGLVLGTVGQVAARRIGPERVLASVPDAIHALGPALVLVLALPASGVHLAVVYAAAFAAGCLLDLLSATVRESTMLGVRPRIQLRVIALVWLIDACLAPLGLMVANTARAEPVAVGLAVPLIFLFVLISRDRSARIEQAHRRLDLVAHERARLQTAVGRLGDALAAKLDLDALTEIVLRGSVEALDADAGRLTLSGALAPRELDVGSTPEVVDALRTATNSADVDEQSCQVERGGAWALALPFGFAGTGGWAHGALAVARVGRAFGEDEVAVLHGLVDRARQAAADIVAHEVLREQAFTDALTGLGNRRRLANDLDERLMASSGPRPLVLLLFDLDGFKGYNDTFGHLAGDAMLARLGDKLRGATATMGTAYRLGGDEFCALLTVRPDRIRPVVERVASALEEHGGNFAVAPSYGAVLMPHEAKNLDYALQLADERMYTLKRGRPSAVGDQTRDVLIRIMQAKQPALQEHSIRVAGLSRRVGFRLGLTGQALTELARAAELHDVGKVGIPDAILDKPERLDAAEWEFMQQHTVLGERILTASTALRPVSAIVRATHERWDGGGYPDGLREQEIPLGSRIIAVCDAYEVMTTDRCYRQRLGHDVACAELRRQAGKQFDPVAVATLLAELDADVADVPVPAAGSGSGRLALPTTAGQAEQLNAQRAEVVAAYLSAALRHEQEQRSSNGQPPVGADSR
jgi:diguanylate cyclase (GGDEF)-like protein